MTHRFFLDFLFWNDGTTEVLLVGIYDYGEVEVASHYRFSLN